MADLGIPAHFSAFNTLRIARVTRVHPESNAVDLVFMDDFAPAVGVPVLSPIAATRSGLTDMPEPTRKNDEEITDVRETKDQDLIAVVAFTYHHPLVLGFMFPQVTQLGFSEIGRMVYRHQSDVYHTITKDGSVEIAHPSGVYLRIGASTAHEDLTGTDLDAKWKIEKNRFKTPSFRLEIANRYVIEEGVVVNEAEIAAADEAEAALEAAKKAGDVEAAAEAQMVIDEALAVFPVTTKASIEFSATGQITIQSETGGVTVRTIQPPPVGAISWE